jgi:hypothetical protein
MEGVRNNFPGLVGLHPRRNVKTRPWCWDGGGKK